MKTLNFSRIQGLGGAVAAHHPVGLACGWLAATWTGAVNPLPGLVVRTQFMVVADLSTRLQLWLALVEYPSTGIWLLQSSLGYAVR